MSCRAGTEVTLITANHCPGAVQLLFKNTAGERYVHCGDMRYHSFMKDSALLAPYVGADAMYLDTTYCHPKHCFPLQEVSVSAVGDLCETYMADCPREGPWKRCGATRARIECMHSMLLQSTLMPVA